MTLKRHVDDFMAQKTLALAGASRSGKRFGHAIRKELTGKGYKLLLIHPEVDEIEGVPCYRSLADLPQEVGGLVIVVPPAETEKLVAEAADAGIERVWMQQGSESPEAVSLCEQRGIIAVHGECILMFAEPTKFPHSFHRWLWGLFGKLPRQDP